MWDDGAIWRGAQEGRLRLRSCAGCRRICHPPLPVCPACQGHDWHDHDALGAARLQAWCRVAGPEGSAPAHRTIIVAELEEGVRFVSNLIDAPDPAELAEGLPLTLCFAEQDGVRLPMFRLAGAGK